MVKWEMWGPEMPGGHPRWTSLITCSSSIVESPPFISSSSSDDIGGYGDCAEEAEAEDSVLSSIEEDHEENNQTLMIIKSPILKTMRFVHLSNCHCKVVDIKTNGAFLLVPAALRISERCTVLLLRPPMILRMDITIKIVIFITINKIYCNIITKYIY